MKLSPPSPKTGKFKCSYDDCLKVFANAYNLKRHQISSHINASKPFKCSKCDKSFSLEQYLKEHETKHTGIKKYQCRYCPDRFRKTGSRINHIKTRHPEEYHIERRERSIKKLKTQGGVSDELDSSEADFSLPLLASTMEYPSFVKSGSLPVPNFLQQNAQ
mmetsp:Transcript_6247/g.7056  ORF Transcript_6247/g.7056 Transcript_6247/m.7056 type:complete len:161 (+) Transcript_6247:368-850(+)